MLRYPGWPLMKLTFFYFLILFLPISGAKDCIRASDMVHKHSNHQATSPTSSKGNIKTEEQNSCRKSELEI